jgi:hypothetical protein
MAFSFEASHGTTFLYNKGLAGNVTIIRGTAQVTVPAADLLELVADVRGDGHGARPPSRARAAEAETVD